MLLQTSAVLFRTTHNQYLKRVWVQRFSYVYIREMCSVLYFSKIDSNVDSWHKVDYILIIQWYLSQRQTGERMSKRADGKQSVSCWSGLFMKCLLTGCNLQPWFEVSANIKDIVFMIKVMIITDWQITNIIDEFVGRLLISVPSVPKLMI